MSSTRSTKANETATTTLSDAASAILHYGTPPYIIGRLILADAFADARFPTTQSLRLAIEALGERGFDLEYLATPAGYHTEEIPEEWSGDPGWSTSTFDFDSLRPKVLSIAKELVRDAGAACGPVRYLSLGIDLKGENRAHIETAVLYDTRGDSVVAVTGKSFPTSGQERTLIRNALLETHLVELDSRRAATLVCHDLSVFNPRGRAVRKGQRDKVGDAMARRIAAYAPSIALHQAHTVERPGTWRNAWAAFRAENPMVRGYTTAFRYLGYGGVPPTAVLSKGVLEATRGGDLAALDVVLASQETARRLTEP
jgi:hypothetical protein